MYQPDDDTDDDYLEPNAGGPVPPLPLPGRRQPPPVPATETRAPPTPRSPAPVPGTNGSESPCRPARGGAAGGGGGRPPPIPHPEPRTQPAPPTPAPTVRKPPPQQAPERQPQLPPMPAPISRPPPPAPAPEENGEEYEVLPGEGQPSRLPPPSHRPPPQLPQLPSRPPHPQYQSSPSVSADDIYEETEQNWQEDQEEYSELPDETPVLKAPHSARPPPSIPGSRPPLKTPPVPHGYGPQFGKLEIDTVKITEMKRNFKKIQDVAYTKPTVQEAEMEVSGGSVKDIKKALEQKLGTTNRQVSQTTSSSSDDGSGGGGVTVPPRQLQPPPPRVNPVTPPSRTMPLPPVPVQPPVEDSRPLPPIPPTIPVTPGTGPRDISVHPWYFGSVDKKSTADSIIRSMPQDGVFLIRPSNSDPRSPYALHVWYTSRVYVLHIGKRDFNEFALGTIKENEKKFSSIEDLVNFHKITPIVLAAVPERREPGGDVLLTNSPPKR